MGIDPAILPDKILRHMAPSDRPKGNAGLTAAQAVRKNSLRLERDEQRIFAQWLILHALPYCWHRTDRATGCLRGVFDFWTACNGRSLWIEFKSHPGAFMSPEQEEFGRKLTEQCVEWHIAYSASEAIALTAKKDPSRISQTGGVNQCQVKSGLTQYERAKVLF